MTAKKRPVSKAILLRSTVIDRPVYTLSFEQWEVEKFASGECPETVAIRAHRALRWQRAALRQKVRIEALARQGRRTTTRKTL